MCLEDPRRPCYLDFDFDLSSSPRGSCALWHALARAHSGQSASIALASQVPQLNRPDSRHLRCDPHCRVGWPWRILTRHTCADSCHLALATIGFVFADARSPWSVRGQLTASEFCQLYELLLELNDRVSLFTSSPSEHLLTLASSSHYLLVRHSRLSLRGCRQPTDDHPKSVYCLRDRVRQLH